MGSWETINKLNIKNKRLNIDELIKILLENRKIKGKSETESFLNPTLDTITPHSLGINQSQLKKAVERIKKAIKDKEQIIIYGDYDVDGICGTAILWETLNRTQANVMPYIPHRTSEGYGLSKKGIDNLLKKHPKTKLIITVDNGIVASGAVDHAKEQAIEVIITDHHVPSQKLPKAYSIVHTTLICGAGVAWVLSKSIKSITGIKGTTGSAHRSPLDTSDTRGIRDARNDHLGLVALATVADVMPLIGFNRTLTKFGIEEMRKTKRPGFLAMFKFAGIDQKKIGVYGFGHVIGPRINATGRITHGIDSLRLICTTNKERASELAQKLHITNAKRQELTFESVAHANGIANKNKKIIIIFDKSYNPGVIGLISGRITEAFYRPSIVISETEGVSKGSARSVAGLDIIAFIRQAEDLLVDAGGHKGAAGLTVETKNIKRLKGFLEDLGEKQIDEKLLVRKIKIDCELPLGFIDQKLFSSITTLAPFGYGNPEPVFLARDVEILDFRYVGKDAKHLKLKIKDQISNLIFDGIAFNFENTQKFKTGDRVDIVYSIYENDWLAQRPVRQSFSVGGSFNGVGNGNKKLELRIKDIAWGVPK